MTVFMLDHRNIIKLKQHWKWLILFCLFLIFYGGIIKLITRVYFAYWNAHAIIIDCLWFQGIIWCMDLSLIFHSRKCGLIETIVSIRRPLMVAHWILDNILWNTGDFLTPLSWNQVGYFSDTLVVNGQKFLLERAFYLKSLKLWQ
jgi:hypothetical protein